MSSVQFTNFEGDQSEQLKTTIHYIHEPSGTGRLGKIQNGDLKSFEGGADITYGRFLDELGWEFNQEGHIEFWFATRLKT